VREVLASCKLRTLEIPSDMELLSERHPHYRYDKTFESARDEPLVVLHTSGTTGLPKPIIWTHDFMAAVHQWFTLAPPEGFCNDLIIPAG
jgi:acyl-coenzyme A synthetase/AMP-(fatty) acid ligase